MKMEPFIGVISLATCCLIILFSQILRIKFINLVKRYWIKKQTWKIKLAYFFYSLALIILSASLFDIRGKEQKVDLDIPDQKTIILLDTSNSMRVEDIRPNRFEKGLLLARHFVKNSYIGQISIVLFSDYQKKYVPFTDDLELLDTRLFSLSDSNILGGSSNIKQALHESIAYLKEFNPENPMGNIILITDGEENKAIDLENKYSDINLYVIGVGTVQGGPIPIRDSAKRFLGHLEYDGETVMSKLDESYIKSIGEDFQNFGYVIATSYSLHTEEIGNYFNKMFSKKMEKDTGSMRPVLSHYLVAIGAILFFLAGFLSQFKSYQQLILTLFIMGQILWMPIYGTEVVEKKMNTLDRIKLGTDYLKAQNYENAKILFEEAKKSGKEIGPEAKFNQATSLLGAGDYENGLALMSELEKEAKNKNDQSMLKKIHQNNNFFLKEKMENEEKKEKEEKEKNEKKEKEKSQNSNENQQNSGEGEGSEKKQSKPGDEGKEKEEKKNAEVKNENEKDKQNPKNKVSESKKKTVEEKMKEERQRRNQIKIPGLLNQLLSEDKNLQRKVFGAMKNRSGEGMGDKNW